ncbi:MAG: hypothetical protein HC906_05685 [Bacteroidales bacterium]|nr:hypothetical protein [Bacteroidales bacterium]
MKKEIYFLFLTMLTAGLFAQNHVVHVEFGQQWGGGSSVDINADGHLDFYIAGNKNNPKEPFLDAEGIPLMQTKMELPILQKGGNVCICILNRVMLIHLQT